MLQINEWMNELKDKLAANFGERLVYVGLQGSCRRKEATEKSDIDAIVLIDQLTADDLRQYKKIIAGMGHSDKACGFVCGKEEMKKWPSYEIFQFTRDTEDYYGCLRELVPETTEEDIRNFVHIAAANLFHEICHRYLYENEDGNLLALTYSYKQTYYILVNLHYLRTGEYCDSKAKLAQKLSGTDRTVMENAIRLASNSETDSDFQADFNVLLKWCQKILRAF